MSDWPPRDPDQPVPNSGRQPYPPPPPPGMPSYPARYPDPYPEPGRERPGSLGPIGPLSLEPEPERGTSRRSALAPLVGIVIGMVVGAVGFFGLAPADGQGTDGDAAPPSDPGSGSEGGDGGADSAGSGVEDGSGAADERAPEEQVIYDLAAAWSAQDCDALFEVSNPPYWDLLFQTGDENEARSSCEATFASGQLPEVTVNSATTLRSEGEQVVVSVDATGWHEDEFWVKDEGGTWKVQYADKGLEGDLGGEGSESGGASYDQPSGRPLTEPGDPPSGNAGYDTLASGCHDGDMVACDDLYWEAPRGSDYEIYGITCGGRRLGVFAGGHCESDFNRNVED
jgi:hypothetical protein